MLIDNSAKTSWKFIGIVAILAVLLGGGVFVLSIQKEAPSQIVETAKPDVVTEDENILREIRIIPMGVVPSGDVVLLRQILEQNFSTATVRTHIAEPRDLPQDTFDKSRNQYDAKDLIRSFEKTDDPSVRLVGVIDEDMYVPGLPFVFSIANPEGNSLILSTQRLSEDYSGVTLYRYPDGTPESAEVVSLAEQSVTRERYRKIVLRALGLTFEFKPPAFDTSCIMAFSNNLYELDRKGVEWCGEEQQIVYELQGVSLGRLPTVRWKPHESGQWRVFYPADWTVQGIGFSTVFSGKAANYESEEKCKLFYRHDPDRKPSSTWSFQGWFDVPMREADTEARIYRETKDDLFHLFVASQGQQLFEGQIRGKAYENCLEVFKSIIWSFERVVEDEAEGQARTVLARFLQLRKQNNQEGIIQILTEKGMQQLQEVPARFIGTKTYETAEVRKVASGIYEFYIAIPRTEELSLLFEIDGGYAIGELIEIQKFPDGYYINSIQVVK